MPEDLTKLDVDTSFLSDAKDAGTLEVKAKGRAWYIINQDSKMYGLWRGFNILCCLLSSYYYAYMAAFKAPEFGE